MINIYASFQCTKQCFYVGFFLNATYIPVTNYCMSNLLMFAFSYSSREARDPYAPPARDSYSTAAATRPTYDYSLPPSRDAPAPQRDFPPATARTASRFDDGRGAPPARDYERVPAREFGGERAEAAYGREYERKCTAVKCTLSRNISCF